VARSKWLSAGAREHYGETGLTAAAVWPPIINGRKVLLALESAELISVLETNWTFAFWGHLCRRRGASVRAYSIFDGITSDPPTRSITATRKGKGRRDRCRHGRHAIEPQARARMAQFLAAAAHSFLIFRRAAACGGLDGTPGETVLGLSNCPISRRVIPAAAGKSTAISACAGGWRFAGLASDGWLDAVGLIRHRQFKVDTNGNPRRGCCIADRGGVWLMWCFDQWHIAARFR